MDNENPSSPWEEGAHQHQGWELPPNDSGSMARPIDLMRWRRDRLAVELARRLKTCPQGFVRVEIDADGCADGVAVGEWSAAARQAGRLLGWSVRTSASEQVLLLVDSRRREDLEFVERNLQDLRHEAALERWSLFWQRPPDRQ